MMRRLSDAVLTAILEEDAPHGDLTTEGLGLEGRPARITYAARDAMVLCGSEDAERMLGLCGITDVVRHADSGARLAPGAPILEARGPAGPLHRAWKTSQTLMEYMSGIATRCAAMVEAARVGDPQAVVACTRKTFPGAKAVCVKAVQAGGAVMHRLSLSETILVFPEHRAFLDDVPAALKALAEALPEKAVVAEAATVEAAVTLARAGVAVLQLEKMSPEQVEAVARQVRSLPYPPVLAAAGGVNAANAEAYARAGCRVLVTTWPYFGKPADVQVRLGPL